MMKSNNKINSFILSLIIFLSFLQVKGFCEELGSNGVSYVLLSPDFIYPGIYKLNKGNGDVRPSYASKSGIKSPLFRISDITREGKVSGLAANQQNNVFVLTAKQGDKFERANVGWLPAGIKFDENSSIYIAAARPFEGEANHYIRSGCPHISDRSNGTGSYWKHNLSLGGKTYTYACTFGGPTGVKFLNGKDGECGTPIWSGEFRPESSNNTAALRHPTNDRYVIVPSHVGVVAYYLYGNNNAGANKGKPMDGKDGRPLAIFTDSDGGGTPKSGGRSGNMFGCVVRRFYDKRENSLDLYTATDTTSINSSSDSANGTNLQKTSSGVLKTVDVKVEEAYGRICGDNCIPGGEIPGGSIETALSTVTVVTSTRGYRYGFNPVGEHYGATDTEASLRVVKPNGQSKVINTAKETSANNFSDNITNKDYLKSRGNYITKSGITPIELKTIGVSSNFNATTDQYDHIYGSASDFFVVQDSWWGVGGIAYEYYKDTGTVVKLDYMNNNNPEPEYVGVLKGKIDTIAIDGNGYLYSLKTEESPTDTEMARKNFSTNPDGGNGVEFESGWLRVTGGSEPVTIPGDGKEVGDFRHAIAYQDVYKAVKRYSQASGSLGREENRGYVYAGKNVWSNILERTSSGYRWKNAFWYPKEGSNRMSNYQAELAVVNVAKNPTSYEGTEKKYICVTTPGYTAHQPIVEERTLTFKVEGYKPNVGGRQRFFTPVGDVINPTHLDVRINNIPPEEGGDIYRFDEDNDGNYSGFTSKMFEASAQRTSISWYVAQVEDTTAVPIVPTTSNPTPSPRLISSIERFDTVSSPFSLCDLTYTFKQPGRYIVQAKGIHYVFNTFDVYRPSNLTSSTKSFTTEPLLVNVYSNNLKYNSSPSFITDIKITPIPNEIDKRRNNYGIEGGGNSESDFDTAEGTEDNKSRLPNKKRFFGDLHIEFNAKFVKDANSNTSAYLQTFDGVGVWDYQYYKNLYKIAKENFGINGITIPNLSLVAQANHIYNYKNNGSIDNCYNTNIYNPGRVKASSLGGSYLGGTQVEGEPTEDDKKFIQWALYLRAIKPQEDYKTSGSFDRGDLIISGNCATASFTLKDTVDRIYNVSLDIKNIDSLINVPRDPKDYILDFELIYPRVTWINNALGGNDTNRNYFSSIVPYNIESGGYGPIHILSKLITVDSDGSINHSDTSQSGVFANNPWVTLQVRDTVIPKYIPKTKNLPYRESTGDPIASGTFEYRIEDNNPFMQFSKNHIPNKITIDQALKGVGILLQNLVYNPTFTNDESNKEYKSKSAVSKNAIINQTSDTSDFYKDNDWKIWVDYTEIINDLSNLKPHISDSNLSAESYYKDINSIKTKKILIENWIGNLSHIASGTIYDGYDELGRDFTHKIKPIKENADDDSIILASPTIYLERYDNDPPSIGVQLISQNDNRKWYFELLEGINDKVSFAKTTEELAPSKLLISCYNLISGENIIATSTNSVFGSTNFYDEREGHYDNPTEHSDSPRNCNYIVTTIDKTNGVPSFRKASRLIINTDILDNCGFEKLRKANITVTNDNEDILNSAINIDSSHDIYGNLKESFKNKPRGTFVVDLPMKVSENQPQINIAVYAEDHQGNKKQLEIPVNIVESSFETRVLESKENKD